MKFKKILVLLLTVALMMSTFAACGSQEVEAPAEPAESVESTVVEDAAMAYFANLPESKNMIDSADLFAKMDAGEEMFVIDIRKQEDYDMGHIKGAVNMPFLTTTIADNLAMIPNDVPVYVNCYTGQTASQVTAILNVAGKTASNIKGGFVRGIAVTDGYEGYIDTVAVEIPTDEYTVDAEIQAAIDEYFQVLVSYNDTPTANQNISVDMVKEIIDSESDEYFILSVRKAEDFALGHVPGAVNIPYGPGMQESFGDIPMDKKIIVYCYTGQTASQTVGILRLLGYEAYNMAFGMGSAETEKGWLGAGFEVVTE